MNKCIVCARPVNGDLDQYCCHGCKAIHMIVDALDLDENSKNSHTQKLLKQLFDGSSPKDLESSVDPQDMQTKFKSFQKNDDDKNLEQYEFQVKGMVCPACSWLVHHLLINKKGIKDLNLNFISERCQVTYDPMILGKESIDSYVAQMGYQTMQSYREGKDFNYLRFGLGWFLALNSMMLAFLVYSAENLNIPVELQILCSVLLLIFATLPPILATSQIYKSGWFQLKTFNFKMESLIVISTFSAWTYSIYSLSRGDFAHQYFEVVSLLLMITETGNMITGFFYDKLYQRLTSMRLSIPKKVRMPKQDTYEFVEIGGLKSGDIFEVKLGEVVPVDGILQTQGEFDFSVITGESKSVKLKMGQFVGAGGKVLTDRVKLAIPPQGVSSKVETIIESTMSAFNTKKEGQLLGDKISIYFVPFILVISFLTFLFYLQSGLYTAITHSMTILIIACPCAFGIAEPLVIVFASEWARKIGIQIFNGNVLRTLPSSVVFDKTGTLTMGQPIVKEIRWLEKPINYYQDIISSLEYGIEHPIAITLSELGKIVKLKNKMVGQGYISGEYEGRYYQIGKESLYPNVIIPAAYSDSSIVLFGDQDRCLAIIALEDKIRQESKNIITRFISYKIKPHICSGDRINVVEKVAQAIGVRDYNAQMSPATKAEYIRELKHQKEKVLMVGDGINDAQALMNSDIGLCVLHGQAVTKLSSDGVFLTNDIKGLPKLIFIIKAVRKKIVINYAWAFIYNLTGIMLAITGILTPSYGALAMAFSNAFIIFNSFTNWPALLGDEITN